MSDFLKMFVVTLLAAALSACAAPDPVVAGAGQGEKQPQEAKDPVSMETDSRPNIIIILADDLGWSDLGSYGGEVETPVLDRLAQEGLRFTQIHNTAKCFPSRAALLTGLYPQQVNKARQARTRMTGGVTIAESLQAAGYQTFMVGKHHSLENPVTRGFAHYRGLRDGASNLFNPGITARDGEPEPARKVKDGRVWCFDEVCMNGFKSTDPDFYITDAYTDWALDYLQAAQEVDAPFFLYLAHQAPHDPLHAPAAEVAKYDGVYDAGYEAIAEARWRRLEALGLVNETFPRPAPQHQPWAEMTDEERADQIARMQIYAAMIDRLDQQIGRIVAYLEDTGELDNTIIVFASDNGSSAELVIDRQTGLEIGAEHPIGSVGRWTSLGPDWAEVSNTPFRRYKNYSFNGGVVTPFIVHWPAGVRDPGRIVRTPGHFIDIHPTLLGVIGTAYDPALGEAPAPPLPGTDLSPLFTDGGVTRTAPMFNQWKDHRFVRDGDWKLVADDDPEAPWELYNISTDKTETQDLAEEHPEIVARLSAAYEAWYAAVTTSTEETRP